MADRRSTAHEVWIGEDDHVWLAAGSWRVDVTQLKAQHDRYRAAGECLYVALFQYVDQGYPCDNLAEIEAAMVVWQDVRSGGASAPAPPTAEREETP